MQDYVNTCILANMNIYNTIYKTEKKNIINKLWFQMKQQNYMYNLESIVSTSQGLHNIVM